MEDKRKNAVLEILNYWKITEFLGQTDIPQESTENKKLIKNIKNGKEVKAEKIEVFFDLPVLSSPDIDLEMILENDRDEYAKFPSVGEEIHFCLGKVERNTVVDYLEKFIEDKSDNPEIAYPKKSAVAWCSFKTDMKGVYLQNSFKLSPILWAIARWDESRAHNSHDFSLDTSEYEELVGEIDDELQDQNVDEFISTIYEKIFNEYVKHRFLDDPQESMGIAEYNRYANVFDDCGERMKLADREEAMPYMLQSIFLLTPVISTTFASAQTFLGDVKKSGVLGTLIVDEAGQAQPQMAVGAMFRCRKAIIVGDPKQIEPVVTAETDMIKQLLTAEILAGYKDKKISVQAFADYINPYGTYLGKDEEKEWVGCPLVVHRRCIDPMYTISNVLSYDGTMKQQTSAPDENRKRTFILDKSCWIDVAGAENSGKKDHFVKAQGELVLKLLEIKFERDPIDIPRLFIITPFTSVKEGMLEMIKKSELYGKEPRVRKWLNANNIGTVHTFQGQGTDEVIFLLGCDSKSMGAVNWVNNNIVNVAATRAKFRFYMIGDKSVWTCRPVRVARECTAEMITAKEVRELLIGKTPEVIGKPKEASDKPQETEAISDGAKKNGTKTSDHLKKNDNKMSQDSNGDVKYASAKMSMICPECGKKLVERSGKFGKFIGCSGFPKCRFTQSV